MPVFEVLIKFLLKPYASQITFYSLRREWNILQHVARKKKSISCTCLLCKIYYVMENHRITCKLGIFQFFVPAYACCVSKIFANILCLQLQYIHIFVCAEDICQHYTTTVTIVSVSHKDLQLTCGIENVLPMYLSLTSLTCLDGLSKFYPIANNSKVSCDVE